MPLRRVSASPAAPLSAVWQLATREDALADIASVSRALERRGGVRQQVVWTGSAAPRAGADVAIDHRITVGGTTHAQRTAAALMAFEDALRAAPPAVLVVSGDDDAA